MRPPTLETARLVLDAHRAKDLDDLAAARADPEVVRHVGGRPSTRTERWARLLRHRGPWPVPGTGDWTVREKATGRHASDVGLGDFRRGTIPAIDRIPEAGWGLARRAHGRGFATEAVTASLAWADRDAAIARTVRLITPGHAASIGVAEKAGFRGAGTVVFGTERTRPLGRDRWGHA